MFNPMTAGRGIGPSMPQMNQNPMQGMAQKFAGMFGGRQKSPMQPKPPMNMPQQPMQQMPTNQPPVPNGMGEMQFPMMQPMEQQGGIAPGGVQQFLARMKNRNTGFAGPR